MSNPRRCSNVLGVDQNLIVDNFSVESVRIDFCRERLSSEKRKHKESVKEYFDRYKQLPMDFNNSDFESNQVPKQQPLLVKASLNKSLVHLIKVFIVLKAAKFFELKRKHYLPGN